MMSGGEFFANRGRKVGLDERAHLGAKRDLFGAEPQVHARSSHAGVKRFMYKPRQGSSELGIALFRRRALQFRQTYVSRLRQEGDAGEAEVREGRHVA